MNEEYLNLLLRDKPPADAGDWAHTQYDRVVRLIDEIKRLQADLKDSDEQKYELRDRIARARASLVI